MKMSKKNMRRIMGILLFVGCIDVGTYSITTTVQSLIGDNDISFSQFNNLPETLCKQHIGNNNTAQSVYQNNKNGNGEANVAQKWQLQQTARRMNKMDLKHGVKKIVYNPKTNQLNIRFNTKRPNTSQQQYAEKLLQQENASTNGVPY